MDNAKIKELGFWEIIGRSVYFNVVIAILKYTLVEGFSFSDTNAFVSAILFAGFSSYPLFVRGTPNRWTKDKRNWTFSFYAAFIVTITIFIAFLLKYIF